MRGKEGARKHKEVGGEIVGVRGEAGEGQAALSGAHSSYFPSF